LQGTEEGKDNNDAMEVDEQTQKKGMVIVGEEEESERESRKTDLVIGGGVGGEGQEDNMWGSDSEDEAAKRKVFEISTTADQVMN
jgi:hypothetical protein